MPHPVGALYPTPTLISGTVRTLSSAASTATSNTKVTLGALATATTFRFSPEATVTAATAVPTAPASAAGIGWRLAPLVLLGDPGTLQAGSATVTVALTFSQAVAAAAGTVTVVAYIGGVELTRGTGSFTAASGANNVAVPLSWAQTAIPAGAAFDVEVYYTSPTVNANVSATTITLGYTTTGTVVGAGATYTIQAARAAAETLTTADTPARRFAGGRPIVEATATSDAPARTVSYPRAVAETTSTGDATTRAAVHPRAVAEATSTVDVVSRSRYVGARSVVESTSTADAPTRALIYGRTVREYPPGVDPDYPVTFPTRAVAGIVVDHETGLPVAGATVRLFRGRDDKACQTATSAADGSYRFPRDTYDPESYYVTVQVDGATQTHGISDRGLVPA